MAFLNHRKMFVSYLPRKTLTFSITCCPIFPPSPPPPEYDPIHYVNQQRSYVTLPMIPMICIVFGVLLFLVLVVYLYFAIKISRHNPAVVSADATGRVEEEEYGGRDLSGANRRTHVDHHVWHIPTVGLRRSAIDSITSFRFKKEERLIDGTECSVCLNEFQEDESLRLLPKCSHAFHVDCIDTWLLSHKNCPLCRAPVLVNDTIPESRHEIDTNRSDNPGSSSSEPTREERTRGLPISGVRNPNFISRAQSDLANHCTSRASLGTVRRCFSIGSSLQRAYDTTGRRPFHFGAKLFSWTSSRIQDPALPTRQPASGSSGPV